MSAVKLAPNELKQIIKLHAAYIYAWANETKPLSVPLPEGKEALLEICTRLFECLEALPAREPKKVN